MTVKVDYLGGLRTEVTHLQSGKQLLTDAPTDNQGKGESFSPTDLLAVALLSCKITTMAIYAKARQWPDYKMAGEVLKVMANSPRRVAKLQGSIQVHGVLEEERKEQLRQAARSCPVAKSLHPDVELAIEYVFVP